VFRSAHAFALRVPLGLRLRATGSARLTPSRYGFRSAHVFALRVPLGSRFRATGLTIPHRESLT